MSNKRTISRRNFLHLAGTAAAGAAATACAPPRPSRRAQGDALFVSPKGDDAWSGRLPAPNAAGTDGPFATIRRAKEAVHELKVSSQLPGPMTVYLRGGRYVLDEPLKFDPGDSAPVTYAAYPGETPIIDGGRRIPPASWRTERLGERDVWVAHIPDVAGGKWSFKQLWVNGQRRPRAQLPKVGPEPERREFYQITGRSSGMDLFSSTDHFQVGPNVIGDWRNLEDVEIVLLHKWIEERLPIKTYDPETGTVTSTRRSVMTVGQLDRFYVENVFEALSEPGEWYLDRSAGKLYYLPLPGESSALAEVVAPRLEQLLILEGRPNDAAFVEFVRFQGLTFEHAEWSRPLDGTGAYSAQAASTAPGVVRLMGARYCAIEGCTVRHIGFYAIELAEGCLSNRVVGNDLYDLGAGGVKMNGATSLANLNWVTGKNRITDNHIHAGGRVLHSGVGVLSQNAFDNDISHNDIHDLYYSGISCGWVWGYGDNISKNNRIEFNHIHDLGHGWLSDMGGIYTLGRQPGTVLRNNLIHDVERASYGGWGIYLDEGSSEILVEDNVCHHLSSQAFHQHYGKDNLLRNNIFALGREGQVALSRDEGHLSFTHEVNICLTGLAVIFVGGYAAQTVDSAIRSDRNLFWTISDKPLRMTVYQDFDQWQAGGQDPHSLVADPLFTDPQAGDFTLSPDSPAFALGFKPIDLSTVGVRPTDMRNT